MQEDASITGISGCSRSSCARPPTAGTLALSSVRDLLVEEDLHPDEVGGDFAGEAERLGEATAEVHADLAAMFDTSTWTPSPRAAGGRMAARLDAAINVVPELARTPMAFDVASTRSPASTPPFPRSASTATSTSARRCARCRAGRSSTSRVSRSRVCPSGWRSTRRCATSPACCARSTTPPVRPCRVR